MIKFLDIKAMHDELGEGRGLESTFANVLKSNQFILGPELAAFEQEFAAYCGTAYCVGVGNGLDALTIILKALGISSGDEVIVPAHTFIATWLSVVECGATPVPVEPDPNTFNIDPDRIRAAITASTRAIVPVHLYGRPADMTAIQAIADEHGIPVIEDAAQSHGAASGPDRTGSLGIAAAFSFYPAKNLGALGDGGAITTSNRELFEKVLRYRNYGSVTKYQHETTGVNSRLDELQAAFLRLKLNHLEGWNAARRRVAKQYIDRLSGIANITIPQETNHLVHAWHLFVIKTDKRDMLANALGEQGIETVIHYPVAPMFQAAFKHRFPKAAQAFPITRQLQGQVLSLPMGPHLTTEDVDRVCDAIVQVFSK